MKGSKDLSVIIVTFNDSGHLKRCIDSAYKKLSPLQSWEIILVNNDEKQDIKNLPVDFSNIKLIDHGKNVGFGSAMNMGAKLAEGRHLLIFNPDTEMVSDNIDSVLQQFTENEDVGIVGGGIFSRNGEKQAWSAGKEISFYDLIRNNLGISRSKQIWNSPKKVQCDWVAGTSLFIKKDLFDKIGGFDEDFFMYFEDMDLCKRVRKEGKRVFFFPSFQILHGSGKSYNDKRLQKSHYYDSMEQFFKKYSSPPSYWVVKLIRRFIIRK